MLDNKTIVNNIMFLAGQKKIKIGVLEKAANCSIGYLSRVSSGDIVAVPPVEKLEAIANLLEVSIDTLINIDVQMATPNELLVSEFIYRVKSQTKECNIEWAEEFVEKVIVKNDNNNEKKDYAYASNDLFKNDLFYPEFEADAEVSAIFYKTIKPITPQIVMCRMRYKKSIERLKEKNIDAEKKEKVIKDYSNAIELYLKEPHCRIKSICSSVYIDSSLSKELHELYDLVDKNINKLRLNEETKEGMLNFLDMVYDEQSRNEALNSKHEIKVKRGLGKSFKRIFGEGDENNE